MKDNISEKEKTIIKAMALVEEGPSLLRIMALQGTDFEGQDDAEEAIDQLKEEISNNRIMAIVDSLAHNGLIKGYAVSEHVTAYYLTKEGFDTADNIG